MSEMDSILADSSKPYRDQSLSDRPGEKWKEIPGMEHYFMVSNQGRIKRLKRYSFDSLGRKFSTPEKIILPSINHDWNKLTQDYTYRFQVQVQIEGKYISFQVQRMVYYCFAEPFDLTDSNVVIFSVKDKGLDIRPKHLRKATRRQRALLSYSQGRQQATFLYDPAYKEHAVSASRALVGKKVSCYDLNGNIAASFDSIMKACEKYGVSHARLRYAIERPYYVLSGFYWRKGNSPQITVEEKPARDVRENRGSRITKFDLDGNPLERYLAISEAARLNSVSHKSIMAYVKGRSPHAGGFLWRLGHHYEKLDLSNIVPDIRSHEY